MAIQWLRPDSEAVERVGYDAATRQLHVVFSGGRRYVYAPVPSALFEDLKRAESVGRFVNWRIKPAFAVREVPPMPEGRRTRSDLGRRAADLSDRRPHRRRQVRPGPGAGG